MPYLHLFGNGFPIQLYYTQENMINVVRIVEFTPIHLYSNCDAL